MASQTYRTAAGATVTADVRTFGDSSWHCNGCGAGGTVSIHARGDVRAEANQHAGTCRAVQAGRR